MIDFFTSYRRGEVSRSAAAASPGPAIFTPQGLRYAPTERLAILQLRAARGWSQQKTADAFQVTVAVNASWMKRLDESGPVALAQLRGPVNGFPDFVRYALQRLKTLCPSLGKVKIARILTASGTASLLVDGWAHSDREAGSSRT